jgi:hypothetical protein
MEAVTVMVPNATFNNIPVISWQSVLLVEETGKLSPDLVNHYDISVLQVTTNYICRKEVCQLTIGAVVVVGFITTYAVSTYHH